MFFSHTHCSTGNGPISARFPWRWTEPFTLSPWLFHLFFLAYAVNCAVFYRDRMDLDVCQFLNSSLLSRGTFFLVHGRGLIQLPPQILPWLAIQMDLSLKMVVLAYSLGYWLYHYAMTLLLYYGFRRRDLATLQVFVIAVYLVHNNFYMYADGMQIVPYALCMLATLQIPGRTHSGRVFSAVVAVLFALAAASSHLFGLPLCLALGCHAFMCSDQRRRMLPALLSVGIALAFFFVWQRTRMDAYDQTAMKMVGLETLRQNGLHFARYFVCAHAFVVLSVAVLAALGLCHRSRRGHYWLSVLCVLGYAFLIAAYLPKFTHLYYWHCLLPMYAILAAPFFDVHGTSRGVPACSRIMFGTAMLWMVMGSAFDLSALRVRSAFEAHLVDALPADKDGNRLFVLEDRQLSYDYLSSFLPQYLSEETCIRAACRDPNKTTVLMARSRYDKGNWMLFPEWSKTKSRYLPGFPLKREAFAPAITPAHPSRIAEQAALVSLDHPERPTSVRVVDGWICNYQRPPKIVYTLPITLVNRGEEPFPARDTEGKAVLFGYYWHRDGKIIYENLKAECLPIDVASKFEHVLSIQWRGIPADAHLEVDLFLNGQPLLHPGLYHSMVPGSQRLAGKSEFGGVIDSLEGFYGAETSGIWLSRYARFSVNRNLRSLSFVLTPTPDVDSGHPNDTEVVLETTGAVIRHRFTDRTPVTVTLDTLKTGQTVRIMSSRDFCPAREGTSSDKRSLAVKMSNVRIVAR